MTAVHHFRTKELWIGRDAIGTEFAAVHAGHRLKIRFPSAEEDFGIRADSSDEFAIGGYVEDRGTVVELAAYIVRLEVIVDADISARDFEAARAGSVPIHEMNI